jgi:type IV fimbrial biogenesis protein FimT
MRAVTGTTLWELLLTLGLAGLVAALAAPSFRQVALDARLTADVNAFFGAVQLARSESSKRGRSVVLCKTADQVECAGSERRYDTGWMVFVNEDDHIPPARSPAEPLLYAHRPATRGTIVSNRPYFEFRAFLRRSTNGTVTFCDVRGPRAARAVIVSYTGRPRTARVGPANRPLVCAGLP